MSWWRKKEKEPEPPKTELPNVCLEVLDKTGNKREFYCRSSMIGRDGTLVLCDTDGRVVGQYASGFWKRTIVLEKKQVELAEPVVAEAEAVRQP